MHPGKMERMLSITVCLTFSALSSNDSIREHYDETQNTLRMPARVVR